MKNYDFIVLGGGAAGFFAAINAAILNPTLKIAIIEKSREGLMKGTVSGGGRCNVTNGIQDPSLLVNNYPRGNGTLLEPFSIFGSTHTFQWFEERNVKLKIEPDGRVFPVSNSSSSIIECFKSEIVKNNIEVFYSQKINNIIKIGSLFQLIGDKDIFNCSKLLVATGSDASILAVIEKMQIDQLSQIPSLFTFNINDSELHKLAGTSFVNAKVNIGNKTQIGPLLITHWGLSGPAILKSSAWEAIDLYHKNYQFNVFIDFVSDINFEDFINICKNQIDLNPKKNVISLSQLGLSSKFWVFICKRANISDYQKWAETGKKQWKGIYDQINGVKFMVDGKSTFKEEFVTAGGVNIDEVKLSSFESKKIDGLYFAGEVLNYDGVTGGFNFQAAWTTAYLAAKDIAKN